MPDIQSLITDRAAALIALMRPEAQKLGWLLWGAHSENVGLEPSGRLRAFADECVETGLLTRRRANKVDLSVPGQRRPRRPIKETGALGPNEPAMEPRLEFADTREV